jgi:hypothetical protein
MFELGHKEQIGEPLFNRICRVLGVSDRSVLMAQREVA